MKGITTIKSEKGDVIEIIRSNTRKWSKQNSEKGCDPVGWLSRKGGINTAVIHWGYDLPICTPGSCTLVTGSANLRNCVRFYQVTS